MLVVEFFLLVVDCPNTDWPSLIFGDPRGRGLEDNIVAGSIRSDLGIVGNLRVPFNICAQTASRLTSSLPNGNSPHSISKIQTPKAKLSTYFYFEYLINVNVWRTRCNKCNGYFYFFKSFCEDVFLIFVLCCFSLRISTPLE